LAPGWCGCKGVVHLDAKEAATRGLGGGWNFDCMDFSSQSSEAAESSTEVRPSGLTAGVGSSDPTAAVFRARSNETSRDNFITSVINPSQPYPPCAKRLGVRSTALEGSSGAELAGERDQLTRSAPLLGSAATTRNPAAQVLFSYHHLDRRESGASHALQGAARKQSRSQVDSRSLARACSREVHTSSAHPFAALPLLKLAAETPAPNNRSITFLP
jgi:hypothetical protein